MDADLAEARRTAEGRIRRQEEELGELRSRLGARRGADAALGRRIALLDGDILSARRSADEADADADTNRARRTAMRGMEEQADDLEGARARDAEDAQGATLAEVGRLRSEVERAAREKLELADALNMMAEEAAEDRERARAAIEERTGELAWMEGRRREDATRGAALEGEAAELRRTVEEDARARAEEMRLLEGSLRGRRQERRPELADLQAQVRD